MLDLPVSYIEPVFRPPSEGRSFILPVTNGCSWNKCTFCEMYTQPQKKFTTRPREVVQEEIRETAARFPGIQRVFLADGDAMVLSTARLIEILQWLNEAFPQLERISSYCLPRNLNKKSVEDLRLMKALKLSYLYVGAESGDDLVLHKVNKGETQDSTLAALLKIREAELVSSVMILNGLGGRRYSEQHALNSAKLVNEAQPDFLATLVVSFPMGEARFRSGFEDFEPLDQTGLFREMRTFLAATDLKQTQFRSDHASNYLVLKGELGRDREKLVQTIDTALNQPGRIPLRQEWQRGL
ncbi:MAG: radical SAM protein [Hahellaceae bacterium]|nr:radical SAM protein [Hahellaceae bacterium]